LEARLGRAHSPRKCGGTWAGGGTQRSHAVRELELQKPRVVGKNYCANKVERQRAVTQK
jgi:hypothetical protein